MTNHKIKIISPLIFLLIHHYTSELCRDPKEFQLLVQDYKSTYHKILSEDNYNLIAFRILPNISLPKTHNKLFTKHPQIHPVVLILHGLADCPDSFAIANDSIVFYFLRKGFEVWLGSNRGTKYSCTKNGTQNTSQEFWDFSWQEMGKFDVPAFINKALQISGASKLSVVGHSQGTTQTFAGLSDDIGLQDKVDRFIAFAPVIFMERDPESPNIWTFLGRINLLKLLDWLHIWGFGQVDLGLNPIIAPFVNLFCKKTTFFCKFFFKMITSKNPDVLNFNLMPKYLTRVPGGCSVKSFKHYSQLMFSDEITFRKFDYGEEINLEKYGQVKVPVYDLNKIKIPVYVFYGGNDRLASLRDISFIIEKIQNVKTFYLDEWGHMGYTWAKDKTILFEKLNTIF